MSFPRSRIAESRALLEQARELLNDDCEVQQRLRAVLDLSIDAFEQAEQLAEVDRQAKVVPLFRS